MARIRTTRAAAVSLTAAALLGSVGCNGSGGSPTCDANDMAVGGPGPLVALVVDGRSTAIDNMVSTLRAANADPVATWAAVGGPVADANAETHGVGIVAVATPDALGELDWVATLDLRGSAANEQRRRGEARTAARCLIKVLDELPPAAASRASGDVEDAPGPALVASLGAAADGALSRAGTNASGTDDRTGSVSLTVAGLGRSSIAGRPWRSIGLRDDQRPQIFEELGRVMAFPDLGSRGVAITWLAPGEGASDDVMRSGLVALAGDLCHEMHLEADQCRIEE